MYTLVFNVLFFAAVVKAVVKFNIGAVTAAILAVLVPFLFAFVVRAIVISGSGLSLSGIVTGKSVFILILQLIVAYVIFYFIVEYEDSYSVWSGAIIVGVLTIHLAIPYAINSLLLGL